MSSRIEEVYQTISRIAEMHAKTPESEIVLRIMILNICNASIFASKMDHDFQEELQYLLKEDKRKNLTNVGK